MSKSIELIQEAVITAIWKAIDLQEISEIRNGRRWGE